MLQKRVSGIVNVTVVERPVRTLIYLRHNATDYFSACAEVGCAWEEYFNSLPEKMDTAAGGMLPDFLIHPGSNGQAFFVEVPLGYNKPLPAGYEMAVLPACTYLYFQGLPFAHADDYPVAIAIVKQAIAQYPLARFGWERAFHGPILGMGAQKESGARTAVPVKRLQTV